MEQSLLQKWEYLVEEMNNADALRATLTRLGNDGWELVSVTRGSGVDASTPVKTLRVRKAEAFCVVLKRPNL
jgi:hypothetical protein